MGLSIRVAYGRDTHNRARSHKHTRTRVCLLQADRLLELGFTEEVMEIVKNCPKGRQTMLFSATMTDEVCFCVRVYVYVRVRVCV